MPALSKKTNADTLPAFLNEQYLLSPAPKDEFISLVAQIGKANLQTRRQGSSIKKADVFRVWIDTKKNELEQRKPAPAVKKPTRSLFREGIPAQIYVDLLKKVKPPIIDQTGRYILGQRSKGAIVAWMDALERHGKISNPINPDIKAGLVNALIPGLNISVRSFGNIYGRAYTAYCDELFRLVEKL